MRAVLVGHDVGLASPLSMVATEIAKMGESAVCFLRVAPLREYLLEDASFWFQVEPKPDIFLIGMSSSPELAKYEIAAGELALGMGRPLAIFSDVLGAFRGREWFENLRQRSSALFVMNEEEAREARQLYPNTCVVASGNPRHEDFFKPNFTREEVREKLDVHKHQGVILAPAGKDYQVNLLHFKGLAEAVRRLLRKPIPKRGQDSFLVVFSLHPGEVNPKDDPQKMLRQYREALEEYPFVRVETKETLLTGDDLVPGADLVVQSASTVGTTAACQRIPVINFFTEQALVRLAGNVGSFNWPPVRLGVETQVIDDIDKLESAIMVYTTPGKILGAIRRRQAEVYPRPKGGSARLIAQTLKDLAESRDS